MKKMVAVFLAVLVGGIFAAPTPTQNWVTNRINEVVAGKADKTALDALGGRVAANEQALTTKATQGDLDALTATVGTKADKTKVPEAYTNAMKAEITDAANEGLTKDGFPYLYDHGGTLDISVDSAQSALEDSDGRIISQTYATKGDVEMEFIHAGARVTELEGNIKQTAASVAAIGAHLNAEDAHFVSTNYDSKVHIPEAYVEIKMKNDALDNGTNTYSWITIWREITRWNAFTGDGFDWNAWQEGGGFNAFKAQTTTALATLEAVKADRAWGAYNSATGAYSPDGVVQISATNIIVSANMSFQQIKSSGVWVLAMNTGTWSMGSDTNGFFRVEDADGNVQFEIVKGDKHEVGADADGFDCNTSSTPHVCTIHYSVESDAHPALQFCDDLKAHDWKAEGDADCIAIVSWSGTSGNWTASVQRKAVGNGALFVKASYMAGGDTYINNRAPVSMESIILGGVKYYLGTATIDGKTVLTLSTTK